MGRISDMYIDYDHFKDTHEEWALDELFECYGPPIASKNADECGEVVFVHSETRSNGILTIVVFAHGLPTYSRGGLDYDKNASPRATFVFDEGWSQNVDAFSGLAISADAHRSIVAA